MKMEYTAMIRRGWPHGSALDLAEPIATGATLSNGDWVTKASDGTVQLAGATAASNLNCGLVVAGNGDAASAANSNKAVVLWGNYIADISNYDTSKTYAPGDGITIVSGKATLATPASGSGSTYVPGDPIIGRVLEVVATSSTETAHLRILVK